MSMVWSKKLFKEQARSQTQTELTDLKNSKLKQQNKKKQKFGKKSFFV